MKRTIFNSSLLCMLLVIITGAKATTVSISSGYHTQAAPHPLPQAGYVNCYAQTTGYNDVTDNMTVQIFWGDGLDTIFIADLVDVSGSLDSVAFVPVQHNYYLAGTYAPLIVITGPDSNNDSYTTNSLPYGVTTLSASVIDSASANCPLPADLSHYIYCSASGYIPGVDQATVTVYHGDGSNDVYNVPFTGSASSQYISFSATPHTYTLPGMYNSTIVVAGPDGNTDTVITPHTFTNACGNVSGYTYTDNNGNCVFDAGDDTLRFTRINVLDAAGTFMYTLYCDSHGHYSVTLLSGITYSVQLVSPSTSLTPTCPASGMYTFTLSTGGTMTCNFGMTCGGGFDLAIDNGFICGSVVAPQGFVPGHSALFYMYAKNLTCTPVTGNVTLTFDPLVTYMAPGYGTAPSSASGSTVNWIFPAMSDAYTYFGGSSINYSAILFTTSTSAVIGDTLCYSMQINPMAGDLDATNNAVTICVPVIASYDPNVKAVSPKGIGAPGYIAPNTELTYTINFQNTGTYQAFNISILDTLDPDVDMSTFQILGSSHTLTPDLINGNIMKFNFYNINLPDSASNEPLSHGWVSYKVKTKPGLANGTEIKNTSYIYFDYNPAVITNTTLNTIDILLGMQDEKQSSSNNTIYPNPATNNFTVQFEKPVSGNLMVIDASGKIVKQVVLNSNQNVNISTADLESGFYAITVPGLELKQNRLQVVK